MSDIFSQKRYENKLQEIFLRFPSVQNQGFGSSSYKPGLGHMIEFERILGCPSKSYRTIHVAGTNGKGSVANMLASSLGAAGLKTGLYTSPHILDFRERMRIFDPSTSKVELVSREYVLDFIDTYEETFKKLDLSFFEITTAMAFKWFSDMDADCAVVEVGLGGRLDSTNIITPDLCVITSIGLDHCAMLGNTRSEIASEKAGIFKKGVTAVIGETDDEIEPSFENASDGLCPVVYAQKVESSGWKRHKEILSRMDLRGEYQLSNLRTVMCCLDILGRIPGYEGLNESGRIAQAIISTASRMDFHGRWEMLSSSPLVICDIGHNPPALTKNFAQLQTMLQTEECSSLIIVYGVMADKDLDSIMPLMPENATYVFTSPSSARSLPCQILTRRYKDFCIKAGRSSGRVYDSTSVREGVEKALEIASAYGGNPLIYIGGSTFVVSEAVLLFRPIKNVANN